MYTVNVYEGSREDPSMYKVGNKGERERTILQGKRMTRRKLVVSYLSTSSHLFDGMTPQGYRFFFL